MKNAFKGRTVLVLGGLGFIGSNVAHRLVDLGAEVVLVDSMLEQYGGNMANVEGIEDRVRINFSDIRDEHSLRYLVRNVDVVFSMAGQTSHIDSMTDPLTDLEINCKSQLTFLECCREYNKDVRIVYASTRQLYGRPQHLPVTETHPVEPVDVNGIHKFAAERYYVLYAQVYGMKCASLRLTNTYGPRQQLRGNSQGFVGIFLRKALDGEKISIYGTGEQLRDFNYIDDVVEGFLLSVDNDRMVGHAYNLGADRYYSLLEFVQILSEFCEVDYELVPFPPEHEIIDIGHYYADFGKFHAATGWVPKVDLRAGLKRTVDYFRRSGGKYL